MLKPAFTLIVPFLISTAAAPTVRAQPEPDSAAAAQADEFLQLARKDAARYRFRIGVGDTRELAPREEPLLKWSNPVVGEIHGSVFVWLDDGRPVVVAAMFKWYSPFTHMTHEFQSLATEPVSATFDAADVWACPDAGVEWKLVPEAAAPAASAGQRLVQMRRLADGFKGWLIEKGPTERDLRLLTQPLLRYEGPRAGVQDGGLFGLVVATDPELLLLLESRETKDGPRWHYALARLNHQPMYARYRDAEVWRVDAIKDRDIDAHRSPYTKFYFGEIRGRGLRVPQP